MIGNFHQHHHERWFKQTQDAFKGSLLSVITLIRDIELTYTGLLDLSRLLFDLSFSLF